MNRLFYIKNIGGITIFKKNQNQNIKKSKFITFNLRNPNFKKINSNKIDTRKAIDFCLLIALIIVSIYSVSLLITKEFHGDAIFVSSSTKKKLPIYSVETDKPKVAISFDAAWGADDTDELLRILEENDVNATFFLCGYWIDDYADEVKKIYEKGHELGNHGDNHAHGSQISYDENVKEIDNVTKKLELITGEKPNVFRPPFGEYDNKVLEAAESLGYYTIQWDVDSHDWMEKGEDYEIDRVLNNKNLKNGSIVLFHNDAKYTPKTLDTIIKGLKAKGFDIVPVGELIYKDNYYIDHTGRQWQNKEKQ